MKLQMLCTVPEGAQVPPNRPFSIPPSGTMPGTITANGKIALHVGTSETFEEFEANLPPAWKIIAAQAFTLTYDYDEEDGSIIGGPHGVEVPVPHSFVTYLPDHVEYDEEGNETSSTPAQPGELMHTFAGADQWVWADVGARRKRKRMF